MPKAKLLIGIGIAGLLASFTVATPANAWHPKGDIVKKVQNITAGSELVDANTVGSAIEVKPGDIIRYVITVKNTAPPASGQDNDMAYTKLTDQIPAGVEMVDTPQTRTISENLGLIVPQKSITKEYQFKVTSQIEGDIINNKACFTGDSVPKDNPQKGCDNAIIKVKVPPTPEKPPVTPPEVPETPETPEQPKEETPAVLPKTGPETALLGGVGITGLGYAGYSAFQSRREVIRKMLNRR
jgi:uncharacterized repeat protein (TIGR01451 family)